MLSFFLSSELENIVVDTSSLKLRPVESSASSFLLFRKTENKNPIVQLQHEEILDAALGVFQKLYTNSVTKEDVYYYAYGILQTSIFRKTLVRDKKVISLPLNQDLGKFWAFSSAGRKLADLHINYESFPAYKGVIVSVPDEINESTFIVEKMRFPKKGQKNTIMYNSKITISNIPDKAYAYVVNGKSAIEWIMERYQVTIHKESGIKNDPNDWSAEVGNPKYILDLLLSIINVSVQTVDIIEALPTLKF